MSSALILKLLQKLGVRRSHLVKRPWRFLSRPLARRQLLPLDLLMGAPLDATFIADFPGASFKYHVSPNDKLGARLFWQRWNMWEPDVVPQFARFAKAARRVLDVGAHTGVYSLFACALNSEAEVFSFEPLPFGYSAIRMSLQLNEFDNRCKSFQTAISDTNGTAHFRIAEDATMSSLVESGGELEVSVITLDSVVPLDGKTDLIKMDVEGHEFKALLGMHKILADSHPTILFECNPGGPGLEIDGLLRQYGYRLFSIAGGQVHEISELVPERFPSGSHNFLALHSVTQINSSTQ